MGFYIRKSFRVGLVRFNLSKSGVGISAGARGFRLGMNGRGTYVHMGRGGLYYRKQLSWNSRAGSRSSQAWQPAPTEPPAPIVGGADSGIYRSENLAEPLTIASTSADEAAVLAHFRPHYEWSWIILICALMGLFEALSSLQLAMTWSATALGLFALRAVQAHRGVLVYNLDGEALERYQVFAESFADFFKAERLWLYESRSLTTDWKRNAGATSLMKRRAASALADGDPRIRTNLSIPCLSSGNERIYFLPDLVVVRQGSSVASRSYPSLAISADAEVFIEDGAAPSDAEVVGHAWQFSRRDGGPDRRFSNNRQLPRCRYQAVQVVSDRFQRSFSKSKLCNAAPFLSALKNLGDLPKLVSDVASSPNLSSPIVT